MRRTIGILMVAFGLAFELVAPASADSMAEAESAWERQDYATAERLYRSLAEQGKASAQHFLGRMYESGKGVPQNFSEARKWYRRAADQGHAGAQYYLGGMYYSGEGGPRDYAQAYFWFSLSIASGQGDFAHRGRAEAGEKLSPEQVADADRRVQEWKPVKTQ
jgi:uncharacterized protein